MKRNCVRIIGCIIGIGLCVYPTVASRIAKGNQGEIISTYRSEVKNINKEEMEDLYKEAEEYNALLQENTNRMLGDKDSCRISEKEYEKLLNFSKGGVMGIVSIPKISVKLPIYHGTEENVLSVGIGHLEGSSLPIGGENTHCILTGHRGLPGAKLFTRLDEMEENDIFFIQVGEKELAYSIYKIDVIEPEDVEKFANVEGNDLVSLVTCTPYGINSHRLVVTGQRVEQKTIESKDIKSQIVSGRELLFILIPFVLLGMLIMKLVLERRRCSCEE